MNNFITQWRMTKIVQSEGFFFGGGEGFDFVCIG